MTSDILAQMAEAYEAEFLKGSHEGTKKDRSKRAMAAALRKGAELLNSQQRNGDVAIVMTSIAEQAK